PHFLLLHSYFPCTRMFIAECLDAPCFPQCPRLPADLAGMEGLVCGDSDTLANGFLPTTVHIKSQPAKLLFHLQHFKLASTFLLEFGDQRFQILAKPPQDIEPA